MKNLITPYFEQELQFFALYGPELITHHFSALALIEDVREAGWLQLVSCYPTRLTRFVIKLSAACGAFTCCSIVNNLLIPSCQVAFWRDDRPRCEATLTQLDPVAGRKHLGALHLLCPQRTQPPYQGLGCGVA